MYLFGECNDAPPGAFDRRFREACDLYNYSLGLALAAEKKGTNGAIKLADSCRQLPVGEIELLLQRGDSPWDFDEFDQVLLADQFRVRGFSVRNRQPGLGAPLICVGSLNPQFGFRPCTPATVFLRGPGTLAALNSGNTVCSLEIYSPFEDAVVTVGDARVPLEIDLTAYRAYTLTQSRIWKLGRMDFLAPAKRIPSQLILNEPYEPGRIPVVFVHGTFSSPVTWAELANSLTADPVLRRRYQVWSFIYGSGNPLVRSMAALEHHAVRGTRSQRIPTRGASAHGVL